MLLLHVYMHMKVTKEEVYMQQEQQKNRNSWQQLHQMLHLI